MRLRFGWLLVAWLVVAGCVEPAPPPPPVAPVAPTDVDLALDAVVSAAERAPGEAVVVTLTVTNLGAPSSDVVVTYATPAALTLRTNEPSVGSSDSATSTWSIGDLAAGDEAVLTLGFVVADDAVEQALSTTASVRAREDDTAPGNNDAEVVVTVVAPRPSPVSLFFEADWGTELGNSDAAITDGGTWDSFYCGGRSETLTVVDGASVGFTRTPNVLRLQQLGTTCGMLERIEAIPLSTSHFGRMYFRNDETTSRHNHVMTYFPVGRIQTAIWNRAGTPTGVNIRMRTFYAADGTDAVSPHAHWFLGSPAGEIELSNETWYRYEWFMEYVTPTTYRLWPRIYEVDGTTPIYDHHDFYGGEFTVSLADFYDDGGTFGFLDVALARNFGLGNEGPVSGLDSGEFWYHAALALSLDDWIGP